MTTGSIERPCGTNRCATKKIHLLRDRGILVDGEVVATLAQTPFLLICLPTAYGLKSEVGAENCKETTWAAMVVDIR